MKKVRMLLRAYGNPDFGQHCDIGEIVVAEAKNLKNWKEEFAAHCEWYREHGASDYMGGGNWGPHCGMVFGTDDKGTHYLGRFSYNCRFWAPGTENELWAPDKKTILKAKVMILTGKTGVHAIDDDGKPYEMPLWPLVKLKATIEEETAKWRAEAGIAQ